MSEHAVSHDHAAAVDPAAAEPLFERDELAQFDADDGLAGTAIGKMLVMFFLYTILAMGVAGWWTYAAVSQ